MPSARSCAPSAASALRNVINPLDASPHSEMARTIQCSHTKLWKRPICAYQLKSLPSTPLVLLGLLSQVNRAHTDLSLAASWPDRRPPTSSSRRTGIFRTRVKDHERVGIFFAANFRNDSFTGVPASIRIGRESVLPPLPSIDLSASCGKVPLLEVPARVRN